MTGSGWDAVSAPPQRVYYGPLSGQTALDRAAGSRLSAERLSGPITVCKTAESFTALPARQQRLGCKHKPPVTHIASAGRERETAEGQREAAGRCDGSPHTCRVEWRARLQSANTAQNPITRLQSLPGRGDVGRGPRPDRSLPSFTDTRSLSQRCSPLPLSRLPPQLCPAAWLAALQDRYRGRRRRPTGRPTQMSYSAPD